MVLCLSQIDTALRLLATLPWLLLSQSRIGAVQNPSPLATVPTIGGSPEALLSSSGFLGVIIAPEAVDLTPRFEGKLGGVRVHVGDRVRQGQVIAVLDTQAEQRELAIAEAELLATRADQEVAALSLAQAGERLERRSDPKQLKLGALSQEELATARYDQRMATAKLEAARARVRQNEARVAQDQQRISAASLRAPFDGVVSNRYADPGALVRSGQPIVHLLRGDSQQVRFAIPEHLLQHVQVGQLVRISVSTRDLALTGRVAHVSPEVDAASQMVFVVADVQTPLGGVMYLPSGIVVRVFPDASMARAVDSGPSRGQE